MAANGPGVGGSPLPIVGALQNFLASETDAEGQKYVTEETSSDDEYIRNEGYLVLPVAGPVGTPPKVVRLHAPFGIRKHHFKVAKEVVPPIMPAIGDTQSGDMFLGAGFSVTATMAGSQQAYAFGGSGTYSYVQAMWPFTDMTGNQYPGLRGDPGITVQTSDYPFSTMADQLLVSSSSYANSYQQQSAQSLYINYDYDYTQGLTAFGYWPSKDFPPNAFTADVIH